MKQKIDLYPPSAEMPLCVKKGAWQRTSGGRLSPVSTHETE